MKKWTVLLVTLLLAVLATGAMADYPKMTLDLACVYDAASAPALGAVKFAEMISEKTNGQITINVFTNGALGTEKDNFSSLAAREIDLVVGGIQPIDMFAPEYMFISAPYAIISWEHLDAVLDSELGQNMYAKLLESNVRALAICYRGVRETTANKPIVTPDDVKDIKFRLSEITSWVAFWKGVGALTTPIALTELYSALQTNVVEASEGPYEQFATNKLYEVQKYVIQTDHIYEPTWLYISDALYQSMDADTQKLFEECAVECMTDYASKEAVVLADQFLQEMVDHGCEVIVPDVAAFQAAAERVLPELFQSIWTVTTLDEIRGYAN